MNKKSETLTESGDHACLMHSAVIEATDKSKSTSGTMPTKPWDRDENGKTLR
jgi:hypothetical protein